MDYGSVYAEKRQKILELRLRRLYKQTQLELEDELNQFISKKEKKSAELQKQVDEGKIDEQDYKDWLARQVFTEKQWKTKVSEMTEKLTYANEQALAYVRGEQVNVFGENANYQAYELEKDTKGAYSFDIYDETTVEKLLDEQPDLLPVRKVDKKKDEKWNNTNISNAVAQSIIKGESIDKLAKRISNQTANTNMKAMTRYARTAMTAAQNAGRIETLNRAVDMGIDVMKQWLATLDSRTRDSHRHLDGQTVAVDKPFRSSLGHIMYPGDPHANPADVYNCRCTMIYVYPEYSEFEEDWRSKQTIDGMTYSEWKDAKKQQGIIKSIKSTKLGQKVENTIGNIKHEAQIKSIQSKMTQNCFGGSYQLDQDMKDELLNSINNASDDMLKIIQKTMGNVSVEWEERPSNPDIPSHYTVGTGKITMYKYDYYGNEYTAEDTKLAFWHEYGHFIDDEYSSHAGYESQRQYATLHGLHWKVDEQDQWKIAAEEDTNQFLKKIGLAGEYRCMYQEGQYSAWVYRNGNAVDVRMPNDDIFTLENALSNWVNEVTGYNKARDYIYSLGYPENVKREDYIEIYYTPKRNLYREREKYEGASEDYRKAVYETDQKQREWWETHDSDAIIEEQNKLYDEANRKKAIIGWVTDTFDGGTSGAFNTSFMIGGHDGSYYCRDNNGLNESVANIITIEINDNEFLKEVANELCPNTYKLIKEKISQ